jgi:Zn-dependent protease
VERPPEQTFDDVDHAWSNLAPGDAPRPREPAWPAYIAPPGYALPPPVRGYGAPPDPLLRPGPVTTPLSQAADVAGQGHLGGTAAAGRAVGPAHVSTLTRISLLLKPTLPVLSAAVSLVIYAQLLGWAFAAGILLLLFVHEMGHFIAIRAKGLPASLPIFIPLIGAYVSMRRLPQSVRDEAEIALAGPLAGALGGLVCVLLYEHTGLRLLLVLAFVNFFINLLNLLPISPLDGGRIVAAISRWIWPFGLALLVGAFIVTHSIIIAVLALLGLGETIARFREAGRDPYYHMSWIQRAYITAAYLGLAASLVLGMYVTHSAMGFFLLR